MRDREDFGACIEILLSAIYHRIVANGDVVIDGGANGGLHTVPLARLVGPKGKVFAYEPLDGPRASLEGWLKSERLAERVQLRPVALGETEGTVQFYEHLDNSALSSLKVHGEALPSHRIRDVMIVRIDDDVLKSIRGCRFIKLDLEGGEYHALMGALSLVEKHKPIISFENGFAWTGTRFGYSAKAFFEWFARLDYVVYDFSGEVADSDSFEGGNLIYQLVAVHQNDPARSTLIDTINQFNKRIDLYKKSNNWEEVMTQVQSPFSLPIWA